MIEEYASNLATQVGIIVSRVTLIDGNELDCHDAHLLCITSDGISVNALVYKADLDDLMNGCICSRLEVRLRSSLSRLQMLIAPSKTIARDLDYVAWKDKPMITGFVSELAARMGMKLSKVKIIEGALAGCLDSHTLMISSRGCNVSVIVYQADLEHLDQGLELNRLESSIREKLHHLQRLIEL